FAKGGGPTYIFTPSFGFVLGYILAAYAVGKLLESKKFSGFYWSALAVLAGLTCLYLVGLSYFYVIINFYMHKGYSIMAVLQAGFLPFIVLDLVRGVGVVILGEMIRKSLHSAGLTAI
ncbi:MAG TPA: biotin transporter BioY, partial [Verrucomicrobiae bacterium]|nr:biotin transporter BioY [Verrucomicrobiae bacterium]